MLVQGGAWGAEKCCCSPSYSQYSHSRFAIPKAVHQKQGKAAVCACGLDSGHLVIGKQDDSC